MKANKKIKALIFGEWVEGKTVQPEGFKEVMIETKEYGLTDRSLADKIEYIK